MLSTNSFKSLLLRSPASSPRYELKTSWMLRLHPSHTRHPTQKFVCRRQHDLNFAPGLDLANTCLSPLAGYSGDTSEEEGDDVDAFGVFCSNRTALLDLSGCASFIVLAPLLPMWTSLILFSSCWFFSSPDATACRFDICSSFPGSKGTSAPCTSDAPCSSRRMQPSVDQPSVSQALFCSFIRSLSRRFCLCEHSSLLFPSLFQFFLGIRHYVA